MSLLMANRALFKATISKLGLVAYYPFNGNANDESGNGNDGAVNGAVLALGRKGDSNGSYLFSNSGEYIDISSIGHLPNFTIACWVNFTTINNVGIISKSSFAGTTGDYVLLIQNNNPYAAQVRINNGAEILSPFPASPLNDGNWHFIVATFEANSLRIRFDNSVYNEKVSQATLDDNYSLIRIGQYFSSSFSFNGRIDDVRFYNRVLTNDEIDLLFAE